MEYTEQQVIDMNRTARVAGAVGERAKVPRIVARLARKGLDCILDYGCGRDAMHVKSLLAEGFVVHGVDIGENEQEEQPLGCGEYEVVYASNVLNVQPSLAGVRHVLEELRAFATHNGMVVVNYPQSPRKAALHPAAIPTEIRRVFSNHLNVGTAANPIWICRP